MPDFGHKFVPDLPLFSSTFRVAMLPKPKFTKRARRLVVALAATCSLLLATDLTGHGLYCTAAIAEDLTPPDANAALAVPEGPEGHNDDNPAVVSTPDIATGRNDGWHLARIALLDERKGPMSDYIDIIGTAALGADSKALSGIAVDFPGPKHFAHGIGAGLPASALPGLQPKSIDKGSGFSPKSRRRLVAGDSVTFLRGLLGF